MYNLVPQEQSVSKLPATRIKKNKHNFDIQANSATKEAYNELSEKVDSFKYLAHFPDGRGTHSSKCENSASTLTIEAQKPLCYHKYLCTNHDKPCGKI